MRTTVDIEALRASRCDLHAALAEAELDNADLMGRVGGSRYVCIGVWIEHGVVRDTRDQVSGGQCSKGVACGGSDRMDHIRVESCHAALAPCPTCISD
ncbi:MAG TPA: hypothetical protein VGZ52_09360 [Acidimicrobiales bacterium]|nr:hypothetical protein [Acidimicrobiales bacterium]